MSADPSKVGAGETALLAWPEDPVRCIECDKGRANGDGAVFCWVFEQGMSAGAEKSCTAYRPIGWGLKMLSWRGVSEGVRNGGA